MARPRKDGGQQPRPKGKLSTSYRLLGRTLKRVDKLAASLGVDKSDVIELAIRDLALKEGVQDDPEGDDATA